MGSVTGVRFGAAHGGGGRERGGWNAGGWVSLSRSARGAGGGPSAIDDRRVPCTLPRVSSFCVFCEIIAGREPADIRYEDEHVIVFKNRLNWVPVMLLAVPKQHMTQGELWTCDAMAHVARAAAEQGDRFSPAGFRLLSNFGTQAMQSQVHAHIHVLGGTFLGEYA